MLYTFVHLLKIRKQKMHKSRMKSISFYADPFIQRQSEKIFKQVRDNPEHKKYLNEMWEKCSAIFEAQRKNGAGFPIDSILRYFLLEYNDRNFKHGLNSLPSSFNIMEAFFEHRPDLVYFKLRKEKEHLFLVSEYFDFLTSPDSKCKIENLSDFLEEGIIYSYNSCEDINDFMLSSPKNENYVITGCSIIRHSKEINILLLIGKEADLISETSKIKDNFELKFTRNRENITPDPYLKQEAVAIQDNSNFWKHIILTRFDLADKTQDVRYILADWGNAFNVQTDDINSFLDNSGKIIPELESVLQNSVQNINENRFVFELCKNLLYLPIYFSENDDKVTFETHKTQLWGNLGKIAWRKKERLLEPEDKITTRDIATLKGLFSNKYCFYSVGMTPELKIQKNGYWKLLSPNKIGVDKNNKPIKGRTWVTETSAWIEKDEESPDIITGTSKNTIDFDSSPNNGYIYVMCSASDKENMFKVGLTRRKPEERANEISKGTGVPTKYLVVQDWRVIDCVLAETLIHKDLSAYRINDRREFFVAPYKIIRESIETNVNYVNKNPLKMDN